MVSESVLLVSVGIKWITIGQAGKTLQGSKEKKSSINIPFDRYQASTPEPISMSLMLMCKF